MLKLKKNISIFILFSLMCACAVGPDYQEPQIDTPKNFKASNDKNYTVDKFDASWWKYFSDDELTVLVNEAVSGSKDIQGALARVNQSRALVDESFAKLLPTTNFSLDGMKNVDHGKIRNHGTDYHTGDSFGGSIDAGWEIDIFGQLRRGLEAKSANLDAQVANLNDALRIIVADVADSYFALRSAQEQLDIAKNNIKIQEETLGIVTAKFNAGQVSELDKFRAETQLEATKAIMPPLETAIAVNIHRLSVLTGKFPTELENRLRPSKAQTIYHGPVEITDADLLLKTRPDIIAAERNLAEMTALIGVAKADYFPKFRVLGSLSLNSADLSRTFHNGMTSTMGPSVTWTPFDFGQIRANVRYSEARVEEALANYENTVLRAFEDVENALVAFTSERKRYVTLKKAFELSKKSYYLAKDQYSAGVLDFISVLSAQTEMLDNENNLAQSREALNASIVSIYKALGGGWEAWKVA